MNKTSLYLCFYGKKFLFLVSNDAYLTNEYKLQLPIASVNYDVHNISYRNVKLFAFNTILKILNGVIQYDDPVQIIHEALINYIQEFIDENEI